MSGMTGGSSASSATTVPNEVFNLTAPNDVVALLRRVHQLPLDAAAKNELRDVIFDAQSGVTTSPDAVAPLFLQYGLRVVTAAEATAEEGGVAPAPESAVAEEVQSTVPVAAPTASTGFRRPAPSFAPVTQSQSVGQPVAATVTKGEAAKAEETQAERPTETSPESASTSENRKLHVTEAATTATPSEAALQDTPPPATAESLQAAVASFVPSAESLEQAQEAESELEPVQATESLESETERQPATATVAEASAAAAPVEDMTTSAATDQQAVSARIEAIKKSVNARVGNPVNLIDANNEVGREYMNALLDAMKKVHSGTAPADMERAMGRLEAAFASVNDVLPADGATDAAKEDSAPEVQDQASTSDQIVETGQQSEDEVSTSPAQAPAKKVGYAAAAATTPPSSEVANVPEPAANPTPDTPPVAPQPAAPVSAENGPVTPMTSMAEETTSEPVPSPTSPAPAPESVSEATEQALNESVSVSEPNTQPAPAAKPQAGFMPVAKEKQLEQLLKERESDVAASEAALKEEIRTNPLMASDVEDGLRQLLSEWKLFKSSGLFGTGPSGIDHPLYKQIANLTMAAVLAGRFDGATSEIRKNINEYMSGWRYEEGITHEMGETFEHYLRRVIRHILDRKRG